MGTDITPGHTYVDGDDVSGPSLTEHVSEAVIKPSFIGAKTVRALALTDELIVRDTGGDSLGKADLQALLNRIVSPGSVIQTQSATYAANTAISAIIPGDDTVPQNTEGVEILSVPITMHSASNTAMVTFSGQFRQGSNTGLGIAAALFRDAAVSALFATHVTALDTSDARIISFVFPDTPSSSATVTYRLRVGPMAAGAFRLNGSSVARIFGGASKAVLTVQELKV